MILIDNQLNTKAISKVKNRGKSAPKFEHQNHLIRTKKIQFQLGIPTKKFKGKKVKTGS